MTHGIDAGKKAALTAAASLRSGRRKQARRDLATVLFGEVSNIEAFATLSHLTAYAITHHQGLHGHRSGPIRLQIPDHAPRSVRLAGQLIAAMIAYAQHPNIDDLTTAGALAETALFDDNDETWSQFTSFIFGFAAELLDPTDPTGAPR